MSDQSFSVKNSSVLLGNLAPYKRPLEKVHTTRSANRCSSVRNSEIRLVANFGVVNTNYLGINGNTQTHSRRNGVGVSYESIATQPIVNHRDSTASRRRW